MSKELEFYVVGDSKKPDWLVAETASGRIKMIFDDGDFQYASVSTISGTKKANEGDVIVRQKSGLAVLTREQAVKYRLIGSQKVIKPQKEESNEDEQ